MELETKYWYLHNHKLFKSLSSKEIESLCINTSMLQGSKDDIIYLPNDLARIYILKKGIIKIVTISDSGVADTKEIIQQGDIFGEVTLGNSSLDNSEYAQALSNNVVICSFLVKNFEQILLAKPSLSLQYTKWVGLKLTRLKSRYADLMYKDVKERLHNFVIELAESQGILLKNEMRIKNVLTQKDIAGIIGATRQTVATLIGKLEVNKQLVYGRKEMIISDWEKFRNKE
jgi:CRP-like cAMP-binding protein